MILFIFNFFQPRVKLNAVLTQKAKSHDFHPHNRDGATDYEISVLGVI